MNNLEAIIDGVVVAVEAKTAKSGKRYAEMLVEVTEALKSGDRKLTLPVSAWGGMKERCLALAEGSRVCVVARVGAYTSKAGYVNVTLSVVGVEEHWGADAPVRGSQGDCDDGTGGVDGADGMDGGLPF